MFAFIVFGFSGM